ncbi:hypothetical protein DMO24_01030 [Modestobacter versicolor]|uniref:Uncharacterized protein n=1 Tax=Modestobacter versicolor TaxID=429133 RepID=A0A323VE75_9ACTN|nr:hypothetical protein DMO24_01030 [Modestobacter versicolor]
MVQPAMDRVDPVADSASQLPTGGAAAFAGSAPAARARQPVSRTRTTPRRRACGWPHHRDSGDTPGCWHART